MTVLPADTETRLRDSFAAQSLMTFAGAKVESCAYGTFRITSPIHDDMRQQHDFGHAALTFALGDTAAGYAAMSVMRPDQEVLTAEMKIQLLAPAKGQRLVAEGRIIKAGRRLIPVEADVWAEDGDKTSHIARLIGTMVPVDIPVAAT